MSYTPFLIIQSDADEQCNAVTYVAAGPTLDPPFESCFLKSACDNQVPVPPLAPEMTSATRKDQWCENHMPTIFLTQTSKVGIKGQFKYVTCSAGQGINNGLDLNPDVQEKFIIRLISNPEIYKSFWWPKLYSKNNAQLTVSIISRRIDQFSSDQ